jgi:hypothetical protein
MDGRDTALTTGGATDTGDTTRRDRTIAGGALVLMAVLAGVGVGVAVGGLVTPDDPLRTVGDLVASEGLFRIGIVCLLAVVGLDVVVGWALYRVYRPVDAGLALLAAVLRFVYAAVLLVAVGQLALAADLLGGDLPLTAPDHMASQALVALGTFERVWNLGLGLFGVHLLLVGRLAYRSGFTPRVLGVLVALAGAGYTVDSVAAVLSAGAAPAVSVYLFAGELLLAVWLIASGRPRRATSPS